MRLVLIRADVKRALYRGKEGAGVGPSEYAHCHWDRKIDCTHRAENEPMNITLTPHGEELLDTPTSLPAEIVEQALADRVAREQAPDPANRQFRREEIRAWLDESVQFSDKIPPMPSVARPQFLSSQ